MKQTLTDIHVEYDELQYIVIIQAPLVYEGTCSNTNCWITETISTNGETFYLGECLVSWISKKQSSVSLSTVEVEYIAAVACCTQVLWMKQTLTDIQVEYDEPIPIYCDNTSAINISKNLVMHSKMKHIPIKYHFLHQS